MKFCPNCGSKLDGKPFCTNCGQSVSVPPSASPPPSETPQIQWTATVDEDGMTRCPNCGQQIRIPSWSGKKGKVKCTGVSPGRGCGIEFTVEAQADSTPYELFDNIFTAHAPPTGGGAKTNTQSQRNQGTQASPSTKFVLACPKCNRAIGLPASTYGLTECICGFKARFRTQEKVGIIAEQERWIPPFGSPVTFPLREEVSLETTQVNTGGSISVDCPQCGAPTVVFAAGYPTNQGTWSVCGACKRRFYFSMAHSPHAVRSARPFENGVPMRPFTPLPLTRERMIYCSGCSRKIIPFEVSTGATFQNYDAPVGYDNRVLPTVGEVWTTCKRCAEGRAVDERKTASGSKQDSIIAGIGVVWGVVLILFGVVQLPFFPIGTLTGVLFILWGLSLFK